MEIRQAWRHVAFSMLAAGALVGCQGAEEAVEPVEADTTASSLTIPSGFYQTHSGTGFRMYRKDYSGGQPDFVGVVDLRSGTVRNVNGSYTQPWSGSVYKRTLLELWNDARAANTSTRTVRAVINGTFFATDANPTPLAFGLKSNWTVIHYGYGVGTEYPGLIRTFHFNSAAATSSIRSYATSNFDAPGSDPDVVGALDETADKGYWSYNRRTFVGVHDSNGDGVAETVLTFSSANARQPDAANVLRAFGANAVAMLDGGGSTGLIVDGAYVLQPTRTVPHAIALYSGR